MSARTSRLENLTAAVAKLNAEPAGRAGWWAYRAHEIDAVCFVTSAELADLGGFLLDVETARDAYSLWCSRTPTRTALPRVLPPRTLARRMLTADLAAWVAEGADWTRITPDCEWSDRAIFQLAERTLRPATLEQVRAYYRAGLAREMVARRTGRDLDRVG